MDLTERLRKWSISVTAVPASDLMDEAADTIDRQNREVSVLIAECQSMKDRLVNGATLTDAEREAVRYMIAAGKFGQRDEELTEEHAATLRGLLDRTNPR